MTEQLTLQRADLLYRTRGRDWDYCFLLQPAPLLSEGWYTLHRRIFLNVEPEPSPVLLRGALGVGTAQPFLATTFTDRARRDSQGRPVAHYLTWLGRDAERAPGHDFGPALVARLASAIDAVFDLQPARLLFGDQRALDSLLAERFRALVPAAELTVTCGRGVAVRWLGTLPV